MKGKKMKKGLIIGGILLLNACAYNPVIDTAGRSGTYNEDKAKEITNDIQHCKMLAKEHTNKGVEGSKAVYNYYIRPGLLWLPDKIPFKYKKMVKECLKNRGHSVID